MRSVTCPLCPPRDGIDGYWIEIAALSVSTLYLDLNQTYRGQSALVFDLRHVEGLERLEPEEYRAFMADLGRAGRAIASACEPDLMNYSSLGNVTPHVHWHIVPRYEADPRWGGPIYTTTREEMREHRLTEPEYASLTAAIRSGLEGAPVGDQDPVATGRDALPEVIETDRLLLRPYRLFDVDDVVAYTGDPQWARFMGSPPYTREEAERAVVRQMLMDHRSRPNWAFVLDDTVIGGLTLFLDFDQRSAEIGYSVGREYWNRGFCTEAVRAVVDVAFSTHQDLVRIHARTDPANIASQRVLEKVGMVKEGMLRCSRVQDGGVFDEACFAILRSEWKPMEEDL